MPPQSHHTVARSSRGLNSYVQRVTYRDAKSYFAILVDDNNRKPLCCLHFNRSQKYLGLLDEAKQETRHAIATVEEIYQYADALRAAAARYCDDGADAAAEK